MSAVSGVSQMLTAVIAGVFGDKWKREWILRTGAVAGFIAVMMTFLGIAKLQMPILYAAQVMWGAYSGIGATGTEAIFADSVATGRRAFVYNLKWMDETLSSCVGIIITLVLLVKMGNEWKQSSMMATMFVGLGVHPIAMLTLWTLRDKFALHEGSARYIDR